MNSSFGVISLLERYESKALIAQKRLSIDAAMLLFLQLKVRLNELSNIYQTEFDQSPAQAWAIGLPELNYGLWSNYLVSKLPLGACSIRAYSISKLRNRSGC